MQQLSAWQRLRTRAFLFSIALKRRMTLGARAALVDGDRVFLIKHTYLPGWQFPGGGVEPGETAEESRRPRSGRGNRLPRDSAARSSSASTTTSRASRTATMSRSTSAASSRRCAEVKPNFEIAGAGWFDRHDLPDDVTDGTQRRLAEIFDGVEPSATW